MNPLKIVKSLLTIVGQGILFLANKIYQSPSEILAQKAEIRARKWYESQGDNNLRLDYKLHENSVVFDLGGYKGQWASDIFAKYCCSIHVFEPIPDFAQNIAKRFIRNPKITIHQFGLGKDTFKSVIFLSNDASSVFKVAGETTEISIVRAIDFLHEHAISCVDLMKINIEGGEYDLLDHLIESNFVKKVKNFQIQFHDFVPDAECRMMKIQRKLAETHRLTYQYSFVWENWKLIDANENRS